METVNVVFSGIQFQMELMELSGELLELRPIGDAIEPLEVGDIAEFEIRLEARLGKLVRKANRSWHFYVPAVRLNDGVECLRECFRVPLQLPGIVLSGKKEYPIQVADATMSGFCLLASPDVRLDIGESCDVVVRCGSCWFQFGAQVMNSQPSAGRYGVAIRAMGLEDRKKFLKLMLLLQQAYRN